MKRFIGLTFIALLTMAMAAPEQQVLLAGLEGERLATARYEAFAAKADADGYHGIASLFRAEAKAERIHAGRFEALLKARGIEVPPPALPKFDVGSTAENVATALAAEQKERDDTYREGIDVARKYGDQEAVALFDETRDAEVEHFNLTAAARNSMGKMREPKTYYVCRKCGYTTDVSLDGCPSCRDQHAMEASE